MIARGLSNVAVSASLLAAPAPEVAAPAPEVVAEAEPAEPTPEVVAEPAEPTPEVVAEPPAPTLSPPAPAPIAVDPRHYKMVLAGDIVIGLGGAALVVMITGLAIRSDAVSQRQALASTSSPDLDALARQDQRRETGTTLAIAGGATSAALFTTGITLVALGYARERKRRETLTWRSLPTPTLAPGQIGLGWSVAF